MLLNYQTSGYGPSILVLHGLFGNSGNWKSIAGKFSANYQVITVDLRNHGRSGWDNDVSYTVMASDIFELMDHLGLNQAILVGHSMGGKTAMTAALQSPQRISGLVVVDIAPVTYQHSHIDLINTLLSLDISSAKNRRDLDAIMAVKIPDSGLRMFFSQNLVFQNGSFTWRINLDALAHGMTDLTGFPEFDTESFSKPSLFIYGENSDYVIDEYHHSIEVLFPKAVLEGIANAGHWVHAESPHKVATSILNYCDSVTQSGDL
ncbi:MAG: esterase [Parasphingorhabdus sp.]